MIRFNNITPDAILLLVVTAGLVLANIYFAFFRPPTKDELAAYSVGEDKLPHDDAMNYCVDCEYCETTCLSEHCHHPDYLNPVNKRGRFLAEHMRKWEQRCGVSGKLFKRRQA